MKHVIGSVLFALLVSGCTAKPSSLGSGSASIPLRPAGATYPGWEYYCASVDGGLGYDDVLAKFLNDAGKQGWELTLIEKIAGVQFCFKRPMIDSGAAASAPTGEPVATPIGAPVAAPVGAPVAAPVVVAPPVAPPVAESPEALEATWAQSITKIEDDRYGITKDAFDRMYMNGAIVLRGARMVPWTKDGKMQGYKVYAIRPGSIFALLGFANGDTVHEINGFALSSSDETLKVLGKLREASSLELTMTRRGKPLSLRYSIR